MSEDHIPDSINDRIAAETKHLHERNNKLANIKLIAALRSAHVWREYILVFYWLYKTFEEEVDRIRTHGQDDHLKAAFEAVHEPLLARTAKIEEDLMFYFDHDKSVLTTMHSPQARAYVSHVREIAQQEPIKLMAYLSVMYLALFAGGQVIKSKMIKLSGFYPAKPGLSHAQVIDRGTNIFAFDTEDVTNLKRTYRARFDQVCLEYFDRSERDKIVEEAKEIFRRNERVMATIDVPSVYWHLYKSLRDTDHDDLGYVYGDVLLLTFTLYVSTDLVKLV